MCFSHAQRHQHQPTRYERAAAALDVLLISVERAKRADAAHFMEDRENELLRWARDICGDRNAVPEVDALVSALHAEAEYIFPRPRS